MGHGIEVTRLDLTSDDLRHEATRSDNGRIACGILAIALILDGKSREEAASSCGMDRQTLRDWVHRYNASGIEGLRNALRPGRPSALSSDQLTELRALVLAGPDFEKDGVASIFVRLSKNVSVLNFMKERWEKFFVDSALHGYSHALFIQKRISKRKRSLRKTLRRMSIMYFRPRPRERK